MGKREVRVIRVRKYATFLLLILVSTGMAALLYFLSGKAYANESHPVRDLLVSLIRSQKPVARNAVLAGLMPVIANILLFVPWGFLMFVFLDRPDRLRRRTYGIVVLSGLFFAAAMQLWQLALPARVTGYTDALANAVGVFVGATAGHLRKQFYVRFDV
jgi:VanZ family protein